MQIAVCAGDGGSRLFALTDDGAVWLLHKSGGKYEWDKIPGPPDAVLKTKFEHENPRARSG